MVKCIATLILREKKKVKWKIYFDVRIFLTAIFISLLMPDGQWLLVLEHLGRNGIAVKFFLSPLLF